MLELIHSRNVGPAAEMKMNLAPRLNLITGNNGLGKSFLLDTVWWVLARTWVRGMIVPHPPPAKASIRYEISSESEEYGYSSKFDRERQTWAVPRNLTFPGLVIYAQDSGGFSTWDPARNYQEDGIIADWADWQLEDSKNFALLTAVLEALSPEENLEPGPLIKVSVADARRHPTLKMPYGHDVPLIHASAGIRRIVALAYLLIWTWQEHLAACELRGDPPAKDIIFLIDEVEAHLHPQWQRRIVPALLSVMDAMTGSHDVSVQLLVVTHAPLVLASVEPHFDSDRDRMFSLDLVDHTVRLEEQPYIRRGEVGNWLVGTFGLEEPRSLESEQAIAAAQTVASNPAPSSEAIETADQGLRKAGLPDIDPFWVRWGYFKEQQKRRSS